MSDAIPEELMTVAWRDFLSFAIGYDPLRETFTADTGIAFPASPKNGFEAAIDKATGVVESTVRDFAFWATLTQWGDEGVPQQFLAEARARFPSPPSA